MYIRQKEIYNRSGTIERTIVLKLLIKRYQQRWATEISLLLLLYYYSGIHILYYTHTLTTHYQNLTNFRPLWLVPSCNRIQKLRPSSNKR